MQKTDGPLEFEQVYREINRISMSMLFMALMSGDNIINSFRFLNFYIRRRNGPSPLFLPPWILVYQLHRRSICFSKSSSFQYCWRWCVFNGHARSDDPSQIPVANQYYHLIIHSTLSSLQEDLVMNFSGVDLYEVDFAKVAKEWV